MKRVQNASGPLALAGLGDALAHQPLGPRPEFRDELRRRLVAAAANPLLVTPPRREAASAWARGRRGRRAIGAALAGASLAAAGTGVVFAAGHALPGQLLFPVKLDLERLHLDVTSGSAARGNLELSFAATRLDELSRLGPDAPHSAVATDLSLLSEEASQARSLLETAAQGSGSTAGLTGLTRFALSSADELRAMLPALPTSTRGEAGTTAALMTHIADQTRHLAATLTASADPRSRATTSSANRSAGAPGSAASSAAHRQPTAGQVRADRASAATPASHASGTEAAAPAGSTPAAGSGQASSSSPSGSPAASSPEPPDAMPLRVPSVGVPVAPGSAPPSGGEAAPGTGASATLP